MENQQETSAQEALKQLAIGQAASHYQWNEAIPADMRPIILQTKVRQTLEQLNASLEVVNGEVELHRKDNPGMPYYESDRKLSVQEVVNRALGLQQAPSKKDSRFYQTVSKDEFIKGGVSHVKLGNHTYTDPIDKRSANRQGPTARSFEEHCKQLDRDLDIRP